MPFVEGPIRTMLANMSPTWLSREFGEKMVVGLMGYTGDTMLDAATLGLKAPWLREDTSPDDALEYVGDEQNTPRYPGETNPGYRGRLLEPFTFWESAGRETTIIGELANLGITAHVYTDAEWSRPPTPWASQFWLVLTGSDFGAAPICDSAYHAGDGSLCGDGLICGLGLHFAGDGSLCGVTGSASTVNLMRALVKRIKAGEEICREAIVEIGPLCGDGHIANDGTDCDDEGSAAISMI